MSWTAPAATSTSTPVIDYRARCRAGTGPWIEAKDGVSRGTKAVVVGLTNGVSYECQVAAIGAAAEGSWTAATTAVAPMGRPQPPGKPSVEALDGAVQIGVAGNGSPDVSAYRYECSGDGGATWTSTVDAGTVDTTAQITHLTNGVQYVCRAYAANAVGLSEPSALSDAAMPCGSIVDCDPLLRSLVQPILVLLGVLLAGGLLAAFAALYRERPRGYVVAVVDVVHSANLGHGSRLGFDFVRRPGHQDDHGDRPCSRREGRHPHPATSRGPLRGDRSPGPPRRDGRRTGGRGRREWRQTPARSAGIRDERRVDGVCAPLILAAVVR